MLPKGKSTSDRLCCAAAPAMAAGAAASIGDELFFRRGVRGRRRGLRHRIAVRAAGVGLVEPYRPRIIFVMAAAGLGVTLQQRHGRKEGVAALLARGVAQELIKISLVYLIAIELRALTRRIDLHLIDLARVTYRLRSARLHDAPEANTGAQIRVLLNHGGGDVQRIVGVPLRGLVGYDLDRLVLIQRVHHAGDLVDARRGREFALHDLYLARGAGTGSARLHHVLGKDASDFKPVGADERV